MIEQLRFWVKSLRILERKSLLWTIVFLFAFIGIATSAIRTTILNSRQQHSLHVQSTQEALSRFIEVWQDGVDAQIRFWDSSILNIDTLKSMEPQWKSSTPWMDQILLWKEKEILYPHIDPQNIEAPCLSSPELWIECRNESIVVQNRASLRQGQLWLEEGNHERAQFELISASPALREPVQKLNLGAQGTIDFLHRRFLVYQSETLGAHPSGGQALIQQSLQEMLFIHPSLLRPLLDIIPITIKESFPEEFRKIKQRQRNWNTLSSWTNNAPSNPDFQVHNLGEEGTAVIFVHRMREDGTHLAILLDLQILMQTLTTQREGFQPFILTPDEQIIHPKSLAPSGKWIQVPGPILFPQFRVALTDTTNHEDLFKPLFVTLLPILASATLGFIALLGIWQADKQKGDYIQRQQAFIARVTHELKTPLAGIKLMAESLQFDADPTQKPLIDRILEETERLELRIDEVLQVAKNTEIRKKSLIDTEILILELYDIWLPRFQEVQGTLRLEGEHCEILGDEDLIKDALQNLLSNVLKYKSANRRLRCELQISIRGQWIEFSVKDNGIGVPLQDRKRIFERFVRIEGNHRGLSGGHGLGLAFVSETANAHNGWVKCSENIPFGSVFTMSMPIVKG